MAGDESPEPPAANAIDAPVKARWSGGEACARPGKLKVNADWVGDLCRQGQLALRVRPGAQAGCNPALRIASVDADQVGVVQSSQLREANLEADVHLTAKRRSLAGIGKIAWAAIVHHQIKAGAAHLRTQASGQKRP